MANTCRCSCTVFDEKSVFRGPGSRKRETRCFFDVFSSMEHASIWRYFWIAPRFGDIWAPERAPGGAGPLGALEARQLASNLQTETYRRAIGTKIALQLLIKAPPPPRPDLPSPKGKPGLAQERGGTKKSRRAMFVPIARRYVYFLFFIHPFKVSACRRRCCWRSKPGLCFTCLRGLGRISHRPMSITQQRTKNGKQKRCNKRSKKRSKKQNHQKTEGHDH